MLYVAKPEIKLGVGEYPIRLGKIRTHVEWGLAWLILYVVGLVGSFGV